MSRWTANFDANNCRQRAKEVVSILEGASLEGLEPGNLEEYARLLKGAKVLEAVTEGVDPELFHQNVWTAAGSLLENLFSECQAFSQNRSPGNLVNANNHLDDLFNLLKPQGVASVSEQLAAVVSAASSFRRKIIEEIESTRRQADNARSKLESLAGEVQQFQQKLQSYDQLIEQQKGRIDQAIAEFQQQFSQAEAGRASEFIATLQRNQSEFASQQKAAQDDFGVSKETRASEFEKFMARLELQATEYVQALEKRRAQVDEIFGAIGSASLAGHFAKTADEDAKAADNLRGVAVVFMTGMILLAAYSFYESLAHPDVHWSTFLFRLGAAVVILVPGVYVAQESAKHRESARRNRRIQVELATIDSYLLALPEVKRNELKEKLTEKFFGAEAGGSKEDPVSRSALFDLLAEAIKNLTKGK